jgi:hypothetical protein
MFSEKIVQSPVLATARRESWFYFPPVVVYVAVEETVPLKKRMIFDEADDQAAGPQAPSILYLSGFFASRTKDQLDSSHP